jgi:2-isopropylmalate synthase
VSFSLLDKLKIAQRLDGLGVDYIEGGYPLSNPKDEAFFRESRAMKLSHSKLCAFGMTRRRGVETKSDAGMAALVAAGTPVVTLVGKSWDLHVDEVLRVSREENVAMIGESVAFCRAAGREVFYDAEHFFDGYRANAQYALGTLRAAKDGGATRLVLCDTNGGSLPDWVARVVAEVQEQLGDVKLGIHTHNDAGLAVANALAGVGAGAVQVQGTINGIGERCGNVDLTSVAANLRLKLGYDCLQRESLAHLTETSRFVYELANMSLVPNQPFVGPAAFAHKGGMHVHAIQRVAHSYEHVDPELVGNERRVLVSELSGASNIEATLGRRFDLSREVQRQVLERVQDLENQGYQFEAATASFELLLHEILGSRRRFWDLEHYRCVIYKRDGGVASTEAIVKARVSGQVEHQVDEGDGPVNALDGALRRCLRPHYPRIDRVHLRDYKVRVVNPTAETAAKVRVIAQFVVLPQATLDPGSQISAESVSGDTREYFATIGVNENIVDASWQALTDAFEYYLMQAGPAEEKATAAGGAGRKTASQL